MSNFSKKLNNATYSINNCPLCKTKKSKFYKYFYTNRYSEEFSNLLKVKSEYLMNNIKQAKCPKCNLIYKKKWFKNIVLGKIYSKKVPIHPSGWDIYSNKFSKINLLKSINLLKKTHQVNKVNFLKRSIISIVQSIDDKNNKIKSLIKNFSNSIENIDIKNINIKKNLILKLMTKPKKFSRFTGFNDQELFEFIKSKVGKINNYTEIGCPLWGLYRITKKENIKNYFMPPNYNFFWGKNCKKNSIKCTKKLNSKTKIIQLNNLNRKYDYIGIYNYIDHINNLSNFLEIIFKKFKYIGIMQEDKNRGYPIQHNYGMNYNCMKYIAKKYKKKIIRNNNLFNNSRYNFYLFV